MVSDKGKHGTIQQAAVFLCLLRICILHALAGLPLSLPSSALTIFAPVFGDLLQGGQAAALTVPSGAGASVSAAKEKVLPALPSWDGLLYHHAWCGR